MKNNIRRILATVMTVALLLTAAPLNGFVGLKLNFDWLNFTEKASALSSTGQCGENVYWTFNSTTGLLTISGSGNMTNYYYDYDYYYDYYRSPFYYNSSIKSVVIENGVTSIGNYAFYGCTGLTSITIPDSVTSIGEYAFGGCTGLTSITIPDSVTTLGSYAFSRCTSLTSVTIPDSVTSIGYWAFYTTAYYNNEENWENDVLYIGNHLISSKTNISGSYKIKDGTKTIADGAFIGCTDLTSITIPASVTSIGGSAFSKCTGLTSITIPDSVSEISNYTFSGCTDLTSITIPDSVEYIGYDAFNGCTGLISVTIPDSVTSIGNSAFYWCTGLTSITIPDSVTSIGYYAFGSCTGLTSITIGNGVTSIGYDAFYGCTGLTRVTIPNSVTSIGYDAFYGCTGLTSITIPDSVTSVGYYAFTKCTNLKKLNYNATNCTSGDSAFYESGIETITVSSNVESIPDGLFRNMPDLTNVIFESDDYIKMGNAVFDSSYNATICCKENSFMYTYAKANGLKYCILDDENAPNFTVKNDILLAYNGSAENIYLSCASEIGYGAFESNKSVKEIELSGNVNRICNKAFANCSNLSKIIIPQSVASIGNDAFSGCSKLTIWCYAGSFAETYAKAHNIKIKYITLSVSETKVNMFSSETVQLTASFNTSILDNDELVWSSDNPAVVTVTPDGKITAVGKGEATITATSKTGLCATCKVYVDMPVTATLGDINGDRKINSSDALLALQYTVQQITLTAEQQTAADVNKDSKVNSSDALLILQYTVGQINKF